MIKHIYPLVCVSLLLCAYYAPVSSTVSPADTMYSGTIGHTMVQYALNDDDVTLLWNTSIGAGEDEEYPYTALYHIDYSLINGDNVPDILAGMYALDGTTGEIIYQFERGIFLGLGDVNSDGEKEIITCNNRADAVDIYCLHAIDGSILWKVENISGRYIDCVAIGDVTGDATHEVVVGMNDVYCFEGITGTILWTKHLANDSVTSIAISDVNDDGKDEIVAGIKNNDARVCCLNGDGGDILWEHIRTWRGGDGFRTLCIDNLNDDAYQEIVVEGTPDGSPGILCLSGYDGSILWTWNDPTGSFQALLSADLIPHVPGDEIIAGSFDGVYCLRAEDYPPAGGRILWHAETGIIMSAAVGDIDGDGFLDVVGSTCGMFETGGGSAYALKGRYGSRLWEKDGIGNDFQDSTMCVDLNNDFVDEVISLSTSYDERFLFHVSALQSTFPSDNQAPEVPVVGGPTDGTIGEPYDYSAISFDSDDDPFYCYYDWGDGTGDISAVNEPGEPTVVSHAWNREGNYTIRVKAIDEHGAESDWGTLQVSMPKIIAPSIFHRFLENHPIIKMIFLQLQNQSSHRWG